MAIELQPVSQEAVEITDHMQTMCEAALYELIHEMRLGMSEREIERVLRDKLQARGFTDYWYNIPILVLAGQKRFFDMANDDYESKAPSTEVRINEGDPLFVDIHPRDESGRWGNFARTLIVNPHDHDHVEFVRQMRAIEWRRFPRGGRASETTHELARDLHGEFDADGINLVDVRSNFGHNMGSGEKSSFTDRSFIDMDTHVALRGQIWGIEPGGYLQVSPGNFLVARIEDCVHVSESGELRTLGNKLPYQHSVDALRRPRSRIL